MDFEERARPAEAKVERLLKEKEALLTMLKAVIKAEESTSQPESNSNV